LNTATTSPSTRPTASGSPSQTTATVPSTTFPPTTASPSPTSSEPSSSGPGVEVEVLSVTDGDTLRALVDGVNERERLIGINAPEQGECLSTEATERLPELSGDGPVTMESDVSDRDQYGRILRYLYNQELFINEALVREGLAVSHGYEPDTSRQHVLDAAQRAAQDDAIGLWNPSACGSASASAVGVGDIPPTAAADDNHNHNDE